MTQIPVETLKKILVIRSDAIGDMALTLPAIKTLKETYPHLHITVLASPINAQLIGHLDYIDDIILKENIHGLIETWQYSRKLKQYNFDCAIHFRTKATVAWACKWAIKYNIGHKNFLGLLPVYGKHGIWYKPHNRTQHVSEAFLEFLKPLGISQPEHHSLTIPVPDTWTQDAATLLKTRRDNVPLICIHPGVGHGNRPVKPEQYTRYIAQLREQRDCDIVITGASPAEIEYKDHILAAGFDNIIDAAGKTSIPTLGGLLAQCDAYVAVDTGPSHMATSIGVPQLAIFPSKRVKPLSWGPWNNRHFIVRNNHNCLHDCPHQHCPYDICSDDIDIDDMVQKTRQLLDGEGVKGIDAQRLYWFKTCMNILLLYNDATKDEALTIQKTLTSWGIHSFACDYRDKTVPTLIRERDISIVHNLSGRRKIRLWLTCQNANKKLHHPPLLLHEKPVMQSYSDCVAGYIQHFSKRGFF